MSERIIRDYAKASDLRYVILRYFNVAGADPDGQLGQWTAEATNLIRAVCDAALGRKPAVKIFGTDFDTPDGTGVRDFIHVADLARAHVDGLNYLGKGWNSETLNCGYGQGYSVRQVIDCLRKISKQEFTVIESARRAGDPASVVSKADKIRSKLAWKPEYMNLLLIMKTAWNWELKLQEMSSLREYQPIKKSQYISHGRDIYRSNL